MNPMVICKIGCVVISVSAAIGAVSCVDLKEPVHTNMICVPAMTLRVQHTDKVDDELVVEHRIVRGDGSEVEIFRELNNRAGW